MTNSIIGFISGLLLPKSYLNDDNDGLPPYILCDEEPLDGSERYESHYYLLTEDIICKKCGYEACIPLGGIPKELYAGCCGEKSCFHDFETVKTEKPDINNPLVRDFLESVHFEELEKTENLYECRFYFKNSRWKLKSGKFVYTAHLND